MIQTNPNIPMAASSVPNTGEAINNAQDQGNKNAMATEQILQQHYQTMNEREKSRLSSTIAGAAHLKSYLDNNDLDGAHDFLLKRRESMQGRIAQGENVDTQETDYALEAIRSGNIDSLKSEIGGLMAAGQVYGILNNKDMPSNVQEWQYYNSLPTPEAKSEYLSVKRANQTLNLGGSQMVVGPDAKPVAEYGVTIKPDQDPELKRKQEIAKKEGQYEVEGFQNLPKIQRSLQDLELGTQNVLRVSSEVKQMAQKAFTTGFTGSIASAVPGTAAYDLQQNLKTLEATAGFTTLQNMRANSPTGGALGAVSERELELLVAAYSNLMNSQSYEQFNQNLNAFEAQQKQSLANAQAAYEQDYKRFGGQKDSNLPAPAGLQNGGQNQNDPEYQEYLDLQAIMGQNG